MAVESKYHEKIKTFMRASGRPVTLREIMEGVGISRPAVYQWKDRHSRELREAGPGKFSAMSYELVEPRGRAGVGVGVGGGGIAARRRTTPSVGGAATDVLEVLGGNDGHSGGAMPDVAAGMTMTVAAVRLMAGHVVLDVDTATGEQLTVAVL